MPFCNKLYNTVEENLPLHYNPLPYLVKIAHLQVEHKNYYAFLTESFILQSVLIFVTLCKFIMST